MPKKTDLPKVGSRWLYTTIDRKSSEVVEVVQHERITPKKDPGGVLPGWWLYLKSGGKTWRSHSYLWAQRKGLGFITPYTEERMYKVTRDCCTSGNCITCKGKSPVGKTIRVVQQAGLSKEQAEKVRAGWARFDAKIVEES